MERAPRAKTVGMHMPLHPSSPNKTLIRLLAILAWGALIFQIVKHMLLPSGVPADSGYIGTDYRIYRAAAVDFVEGRNPFDGRNYLRFPYPMFTAVFCSFLAFLSPAHAETVWNILIRSLICGGFLIVIFFCRPGPIAGGEKGRAYLPKGLSEFLAAHWQIVAVLLAASYTPAFWGIFYGNIQPLAFFLICLLCALLVNGRDRAAGCVLAMACLVKITPILLLPGFLFARKFRVLAAWAVFMAVYLGMLLVTGWWRYELFYVRQTLPHQAFQWVFTSASIVVYLGKVVWPSILESKAAFDLVSKCVALACGGLSLIVLGLASRVSGRRTGKDGKPRGRGLFWRDAYSLCCYPMLLMSPLLEIHHFTVAFPALVFLFHDYIERRIGHWYFAVMMYFWIVFLGYSAWIDLGGLEMPSLLGPQSIIPWEFYGIFCLAALWAISSVRSIFLPLSPPPEKSTNFSSVSADDAVIVHHENIVR